MSKKSGRYLKKDINEEKEINFPAPPFYDEKGFLKPIKTYSELLFCCDEMNSYFSIFYSLVEKNGAYFYTFQGNHGFAVVHFQKAARDKWYLCRIYGLEHLSTEEENYIYNWCIKNKIELEVPDNFLSTIATTLGK